MMVKRFLVGILLFNSLTLSAKAGTDSTKYCVHENCSIAMDLLNTCDSCLIIVGPELFDYSIIETDIEKAVLKLLWGSKVSNFRRITVGPLQMNYLFLQEYSECDEITMDRMFNLDFQIQTLIRFIDSSPCVDLINVNSYYFLSQKYNSGSCSYNDCYTTSREALNRSWTYYEFGQYLYDRIKQGYCFYERDDPQHSLMPLSTDGH